MPSAEKNTAGRTPHPVVESYLDAVWLEKGLSDNTLSAYRRDLAQWQGWLLAKHTDLLQARRSDVLGFLADQATKSARSSARMLSCLRGFYRYQLRESRIPLDPTLNVDAPKIGRSLPKSLSEQDVDKLLAEPNTEELIELRDRAMLELLYATGLRVSELVGLQMEELGMSQGVVRVVGKGNKERLVPMGEEALLWLARYINGGRREQNGAARPGQCLLQIAAGR